MASYHQLSRLSPLGPAFRLASRTDRRTQQRARTCGQAGSQVHCLQLGEKRSWSFGDSLFFLYSYYCNFVWTNWVHPGFNVYIIQIVFETNLGSSLKCRFFWGMPLQVPCVSRWSSPVSPSLMRWKASGRLSQRIGLANRFPNEECKSWLQYW